MPFLTLLIGCPDEVSIDDRCEDFFEKHGVKNLSEDGFGKHVEQYHSRSIANLSGIRCPSTTWTPHGPVDYVLR